MKKTVVTILKKAVVGLIVAIILNNIAFAGESANIAVSCTIPEVPGLNAPLIEEKTASSEPNTATPQTQNNNEINLARADDSASTITTTTYSR